MPFAVDVDDPVMMNSMEKKLLGLPFRGGEEYPRSGFRIKDGNMVSKGASRL
jgi:hypothetical protein